MEYQVLCWSADTAESLGSERPNEFTLPTNCQGCQTVYNSRQQQKKNISSTRLIIIHSKMRGKGGGSRSGHRPSSHTTSSLATGAASDLQKGRAVMSADVGLRRPFCLRVSRWLRRCLYKHI